MARDWTDSRDQTKWLVDAKPLDLGRSDDLPTVAWMLVFYSHGDHRLLPVGYELGANLDRLKDRELIALLDAAQLDPTKV